MIDGKKHKALTVKVDHETYIKLKTYVAEHGTSIQDLLYRCIQETVNK
ncbi:MAG: hypothetical protein K0M69_15670 [Youngiibacter sp.]|nr:hypothetical protein [Youngiibacter sp.]